MKAYNIESPDQLKEHLAKTHKVFLPLQPKDDVVRWSEAGANGTDKYNSDLVLPQYSAKSMFFAEREVMFSFDGRNFKSTIGKRADMALFGIRACDLTAISYQDKFFKSDPYYQARRNAALLVGVDCIAPCDGGFCPSMDSGPTVRTNTADLVLTRISRGQDKNWILTVLTAKGESAIDGFDFVACPDGESQRNKIEHEVRAAFGNHDYIETGIRNINQRKVPQAIWDTLGIQCVTCSGCSNVCPTCSCYTNFDRSRTGSNGFDRIRIWDSCLFEAFQKEASGHNPSKEPGKRVQRYWYHKMSDDFKKDFGRYGCVGCGRCETACPGTIGVHSVMQRIAAL